MVAELKSTTHYGLSMRINTSSKVKVTTQFFNSVFVQPPDGRVRKTRTFSSDWFGPWQISSWWKLGILLDWCPHLCLAPAEASGLGIYCSLNEPEALLLVSSSGSLKTSQLARVVVESRGGVGRERELAIIMPHPAVALASGQRQFLKLLNLS